MILTRNSLCLFKKNLQKKLHPLLAPWFWLSLGLSQKVTWPACSSFCDHHCHEPSNIIVTNHQNIHHTLSCVGFLLIWHCRLVHVPLQCRIHLPLQCRVHVPHVPWQCRTTPITMPKGHVQPIALGVSFSKAQSSKLERLFFHVSMKRHVRALSFEL